jgi:hypothetical protein
VLAEGDWCSYHHGLVFGGAYLRPCNVISYATEGRHRCRARKAQTRLPCHPAGNRAHFPKRLPEAVPDIGDLERIDIAKPGTARYPSYAGRTLRRRL